MGINKDFVPQTTVVVVMVLHPGHSIIDQAHTQSVTVGQARRSISAVTASHMKINGICDQVTLRNCQAQE